MVKKVIQKKAIGGLIDGDGETPKKPVDTFTGKTPAEWDAYNKAKGLAPYPITDMGGKYKQYYDTNQYSVTPDASRESGFALKGLNSTANTAFNSIPTEHLSIFPQQTAPVAQIQEQTTHGVSTSKNKVTFVPGGGKIVTDPTGASIQYDKFGKVVPTVGMKKGGKVKGYDDGGPVQNPNPFINNNDAYMTRLTAELGTNKTADSTSTNPLGQTPTNTTNNNTATGIASVLGQFANQRTQTPIGTTTANPSTDLGKEQLKEQQNNAQGKQVYNLANGIAGKLGNPLVGGIASAATMGTDMLGNTVQNRMGADTVRGEATGDAIRDAGKGAALGVTVGSNPALMAATGGLSAPIGLGAGLLIGGTEGAVRGTVQAKKQAAAKYKDKEILNEDNALNNQYVASAANLRAEGGLINAIGKKKPILVTSFANGGKVKGGIIEGKGGPKSDSINADVKANSFVVPHENLGLAKVLREQILNKNPNEKANLKQDGGEPVKLSNGEMLFTPGETQQLIKNGVNPHLLAPNSDDTRDGQDSDTGLWHLLNGGKVKMCAEGGGVKGYEKGGPVKGEKAGDATYDGQKWVDAQGNTISQDYVNKFKQAEVAKQKDFDSQRVKMFQRQYDFIKNDPSRAKEASAIKASIDKINGVTPTQTNQNIYNSGAKPKTGLASVLDKTQYEPMNAKEAPSLVNQVSAPQGTTEMVEPVNNSSGDNRFTTKNQKQGNQNNGLGLEQALAGAQAVGGLGYLLKSKRPNPDTVDPLFQNQVNQSIKNASYGYTPEQKALLQNDLIENRNQGLANVYNMSGGNGSVALGNARAVFNDAYRNQLGNASEDESLRMSKQGQANQMASVHQAKLRQLWEDSMNRFNQNQNAGATLLNTGLSNFIGAGRYRQAKQAQDQISKIDDMYSSGPV